MICDSLARAELYPLGPSFIKAIDALKNLSPDTPDGSYEVEGKKIYINVMTYTTSNAPAEKYEYHREYADIQVVLKGAERLYSCDLAPLREKDPYDSGKDCGFTFPPEGPFGTALEMREGDFAFFFPMDAHAGKGASLAAGEMTIRKAVAKVAIELLK